MKQNINKTKEWIKHLFLTITKPEMAILPGQIAFFLVLAIIPLISLVGIAGNFFFLSIDRIIEFVSKNFPTDLSQTIVQVIQVNNVGTGVISFLILAFLISSSGAYSIIVASNMLYGMEETKNWLTRRIKSIIMIILILLLFILALLIPVFGIKFISLLQSSNFVSSGLLNQFIFIYQILKWPISFILIFIIIKLVYTMAPDKKVKSKYVNKGAIFTSLSWIIITLLYSYYITNYSFYHIIYGTLSNLIILMLWIYFLSFLFVFGMSLNSNYYHLNIEKEQ